MILGMTRPSGPTGPMIQRLVLVGCRTIPSGAGTNVPGSELLFSRPICISSGMKKVTSPMSRRSSPQCARTMRNNATAAPVMITNIGRVFLFNSDSRIGHLPVLLRDRRELRRPHLDEVGEHLFADERLVEEAVAERHQVAR